MSLTIDGETYYSLRELTDLIGVSRQTLWRWRKEGRVPVGRKYRRKHVVFSEAETREIKRLADRLEPADLQHASASNSQAPVSEPEEHGGVA